MNTVKEYKKNYVGWVEKEGGFRAGLDALPVNMQKQAREEICRLCYWSIPSFYNRSKGRSRYRVYEVAMIEKFFADRGLDAWTGRLLSNPNTN